ncbi:MAG TPA: branched-chain amino acid transaminase, partial [Candidatus Acidoferrales bacterium]|nr:branched-chain amino acid transaminase [Candidatus Acidoferrales bacterium]
LREHYVRLTKSSRILMMKMPHTVDELIELTVDVCARNRFDHDVYIRPFIYKSAEEIGVRLAGVTDSFAIVAIPYKAYYGAAVGLKACLSPWRRIDDTMAPARAKVTGIYINSALAKSEAQLGGFDEAILLSSDGHVAEGSADNIFVVRDGTLYTPDASQNILEGVTRKCVITLAKDEFGIPVVERAIDRSELYCADEVFVTGTAAGLMPVISIDYRAIGDGQIGSTTRRLTEAYENAVNGRNPKYRAWLTPTYANRSAGVT